MKEHSQNSTAPEIDLENYQEAIPVETKIDESSTFSGESKFPITNTVFTSSDNEGYLVKVEPQRVKKALESIAKNRQLQEKGLG